MASRAQIRTWLQRRLQDTSAATWTATVLNDYINEGLRDLCAAVRRIEPEFVVYTDQRNIDINERLYLVPTNCERVLEVWTKENATADYERAEYRRRISQDEQDEDTTTNSLGVETSYAMEGRYIRLHPSPAAAVALGLQLKYVPILALSSDAEVPPIPTSLHRGIVLAAQIVAYGDTAEVADKEAVEKELAKFLALNVAEHDVNADNDEFLTFPSNLRITAQDDSLDWR